MGSFFWVLKARYYPDCHLLQARRTGGSSYTWSGIWEAKEEMKMGLRWVLGDGQSINISADRWLRGKQVFRIDQHNGVVNRNLKVCDFFLEDKKNWDVSKVTLNFNQIDAAAIINTRIPQNCTTDRVAWIHSSNGQYTTKMRYQQWHKNHVGDFGVQQSRGWNRIWSLEVPHKLKIFLWRICHNNIPVRNILRSKDVQVLIGCIMCVGDVEHLLHLFFNCNFAQECWSRVGLVYDMMDVDSAPD